ncbi:hypothetical protein MNBD_BACTEROID06-1366 [hydrothermal vent metagenome]|uniref:Uncharacterized protein n=1 Tax=hydrothermal vent metagenome TaxID=652676 RepID=A0A3B0UW40_9ZZZZ
MIYEILEIHPYNFSYKLMTYDQFVEWKEGQETA